MECFMQASILKTVSQELLHQNQQTKKTDFKQHKEKHKTDNSYEISMQNTKLKIKKWCIITERSISFLFMFVLKSTTYVPS